MSDEATPPELNDDPNGADPGDRPQGRADADEQETIASYLRQRATWSPCWGVRSTTRPVQATR